MSCDYYPEKWGSGNGDKGSLWSIWPLIKTSIICTVSSDSISVLIFQQNQSHKSPTINLGASGLSLSHSPLLLSICPTNTGCWDINHPAFLHFPSPPPPPHSCSFSCCLLLQMNTVGWQMQSVLLCPVHFAPASYNILVLLFFLFFFSWLCSLTASTFYCIVVIVHLSLTPGFLL